MSDLFTYKNEENLQHNLTLDGLTGCDVYGVYCTNGIAVAATISDNQDYGLYYSIK